MKGHLAHPRCYYRPDENSPTETWPAMISVYFDPDVMKSLSACVARREQSMSLIAEAAIAKRLYQQDRRLARLERDVGISVKTLVLFVRFWRISRRPPLPEPAVKAARARAGAS
jgi:hypothetical protein